MYAWWQFSKRRHCPHSFVRGIYGDEITRTPGWRRVECRDCGRLLDGPVRIAVLRRDEPVLAINPQPSDPSPSGVVQGQ